MKVPAEGAWFDDPAFTRAGFKLKPKMHRYDVLGRTLAVYRYCLERRTATLSVEDVDGLAECAGFAAALVSAGIASNSRTRGPKTGSDSPKVRLPGIEPQLKWLKGQDDKRTLANEARRSRGKSPGRPAGHHSDLDPDRDRDPVPAAALAPGLDPESKEQQQQVQQTEQLQQHAPPAVRSGWTPPAGGRAALEARRRVAAGEITIADVTACWEYCEAQGVPSQRNADERAAKLIAIQKPKRNGARRSKNAIASHDEWSDEDGKW